MWDITVRCLSIEVYWCVFARVGQRSSFLVPIYFAACSSFFLVFCWSIEGWWKDVKRTVGGFWLENFPCLESIWITHLLEVLAPYLSRILRKLRILFDIQWNSQVDAGWVGWQDQQLAGSLVVEFQRCSSAKGIRCVICRSLQDAFSSVVYTFCQNGCLWQEIACKVRFHPAVNTFQKEWT